MITNHVQTSDIVYCRLLNRVLPLSVDHVETNCLKQCQYYNGSAQGEGVECRFEDGTTSGLDKIGSEADAQRLYEEMQQRMSLKGLDALTAILTSRYKGGAGSGFFAHAGRTGKIGGSAAIGTITVGGGGEVPAGEYDAIWSGKPGAGGRGTALKKAALDPSYKVVRVGGAYHVIDTTPKVTTPPPPMVTVGWGKALGLPGGKYETVYSIPTSKKAAEAKATKLGPGYMAVRAEGAYHVIKTGAAATPPPTTTKITPDTPKETVAKVSAPSAMPAVEKKSFAHLGFDVTDPANKRTEAAVTAKAERSSFTKTGFEELKKLIKGAPVCINVPRGVVGKILADGRFKNQLETGTSRGSLSPSYRRKAEQNAFEIPSDSPAGAHPIYGYVDTSKNGYTPSTGGYGDGIRAVMHYDVHNRTTITGFDSLGPFASREAVGTPLKAPRIASMDTRSGIGSYVEAQIHGGVNLSDVYKWQITKETATKYPEVRHKLEAAGFKVEVFDFSESRY